MVQAIASALNLSAETLLEQAGAFDHDATHDTAVDTEAAIRSDSRLTDEQKQALLSVYRSYVQTNVPSDSLAGEPSGDASAT